MEKMSKEEALNLIGGVLDHYKDMYLDPYASDSDELDERVAEMAKLQAAYQLIENLAYPGEAQS